jgi:hypothetical protein
MNLIYSRNHSTPHGGRCRIKIFVGGFGTGDLPVVICTEPRDNPGQSITNCAEQLAAEVLLMKPDVFHPANVGQYADQYDKPFTWIEHYQDGARGTPQDRATFDMVEFAHYEPRDVLRAGQWVKEIGMPTWQPLNRATVEALVGQAVR